MPAQHCELPHNVLLTGCSSVTTFFALFIPRAGPHVPATVGARHERQSQAFLIAPVFPESDSIAGILEVRVLSNLNLNTAETEFEYWTSLDWPFQVGGK